jgi:hypothetical protein
LSQLKVRAGCPLQICRSPFAVVSTETAEAKLSGETRQVVDGYRLNIVQVRFGADPRYAALIVTSFLRLRSCAQFRPVRTIVALR